MDGDYYEITNTYLGDFLKKAGLYGLDGFIGFMSKVGFEQRISEADFLANP